MPAVQHVEWAGSASQPGNDQFSAAPDVIRSFIVRPEGFKYLNYLARIVSNDSNDSNDSNGSNDSNSN